MNIFSYGFQPASFSPIPVSLDRQQNSVTPNITKRGPINISFNPPSKEQSNKPKIAFPGFLPFRYWLEYLPSSFYIIIVEYDLANSGNKDNSATGEGRGHFSNIQGKLLNQYLKIKSIGEGPYSKIKLMFNTKDGLFYAMKKYNLFILKKKNKLLKKDKGQGIY